jgi:hypothetical protein
MKALFSGNKILNGLIIGVLSFAVFLGLLLVTKNQLENLPYWLESQKATALLALIPNVLLIRVYFINRKSDRTGRGILVITFAAMLAIFLFLK